MLLYETPTMLRLVGYENREADLRRILTYTDKKVVFEQQRIRKSSYLLQQKGAEYVQEQLNELEQRKKVCLLNRDEEGLWTYTGLAPKLAARYRDEVAWSYAIQEPLGWKLPWFKPPEHKARYYQELTHDKLLKSVHGGCEIGTGLGKSFIIEMLLKSLGVKALVMAPFKNIAEQLYSELVAHFGKKLVGFFGDGKHEVNKLITVGIAQSLTRIEPGSDLWTELSKAQVFIADESHMTPAETLSKVCFGLMGMAGYRFFFSGTQVRGDGLDLLLEAITGDIVYRMTVREGVDQNFLAKPVFRMLSLDSDIRYESSDAIKMTRKHLQYNPRVLKLAGELVNRAVCVEKRPVLVLVDELEQFTKLLPYLRVEARFAHGGVNKGNKDSLPEQYHKSNPSQLVDQFNRHEFPVLVGTSCISTGTDIKAVQAMVYLRGGKSEVEAKQGVGRCTRLCDGKTDCVVFDFDIRNIDILHRHTEYRRGYYNEIYPNLFELEVKI